MEPIGLSYPSGNHRRQFVRTLLLGSAASMVAGLNWRGTAVASVIEQEAGPGLLKVRIADFAPLSAEFGSVRLGFAALNPLSPVGAVLPIIVSKDGEDFFAVSSQCTHEGCATPAFSANKVSTCPCHGSRYSPDGSVLSGPATDPLRSYEVSNDGAGVLTIAIPEMPAFEVVVREVVLVESSCVALEFTALQNIEYEVLARGGLDQSWEARPFSTTEDGELTQTVFRSTRRDPVVATLFVPRTDTSTFFAVATRLRRV